jgi:multidrug efflux pump subunit AcrB
VIDDKIVVVENIVLHRDAGQGPLEATASALKELTVPLIGSTLTPIVVFLPLITITGVTGTFFSALAIAMSVALLTSLVLALVWTSNLGTRLIRRGKGHHHEEYEHGFFGHIVRFYVRWVRRSLEHPVFLGIFCVLLVVVAYLSYRQLGSGLLPAMDEGGFILDYDMPPGSSLQETNRVLNHVERIIRETPEVESTSRRTGLQLGIFPVTEPNTGDFTVKLKDQRKRGIDDVIAEIRDKVKKSEPVLGIEFVQLLQDMIGDLSGGAPEPVVVKMFSDNADLLKDWAPQVADTLMKVDIGGKKPIVDIEDGIEKTTSGPAVTFNVNPERVSRAGFAADDLEIATAAIMDGEPTAQPVIINERPYTLRIRYPAASHASLEALTNTMLVNSNGATATLGSLTGISEEPGQTEVLRENLQRVVNVTARLEGVDLGTGIAAVQKAVADMKLPPSIRVVYGGIYEQQQKSFRDLVTVLVLAIVLIFLVLLFEFRSYTAPIAILSSAVLSTSGVCFALLITRTEFNVSSFMGLIMVVGIVAKNGILLLDANHKYLAAGMPAEEAMIQAGRRRLRPIVMTALAAVAGMLPLALAIGAGSQMLQPLAIAVIGGIMVSMVLSLIITPAIQYYLNKGNGRDVPGVRDDDAVPMRSEL